jgi:hypothetical protein
VVKAGDIERERERASKDEPRRTSGYEEMVVGVGNGDVGAREE